jgi:hypothetical protein
MGCPFPRLFPGFRGALYLGKGFTAVCAEVRLAEGLGGGKGDGVFVKRHQHEVEFRGGALREVSPPGAIFREKVQVKSGNVDSCHVGGSPESHEFSRKISGREETLFLCGFRQRRIGLLLGRNAPVAEMLEGSLYENEPGDVDVGYVADYLLFQIFQRRDSGEGVRLLFFFGPGGHRSEGSGLFRRNPLHLARYGSPVADSLAEDHFSVQSVKGAYSRSAPEGEFPDGKAPFVYSVEKGIDGGDLVERSSPCRSQEKPQEKKSVQS